MEIDMMAIVNYLSVNGNVPINDIFRKISAFLNPFAFFCIISVSIYVYTILLQFLANAGSTMSSNIFRSRLILIVAAIETIPKTISSNK